MLTVDSGITTCHDAHDCIPDWMVACPLARASAGALDLALLAAGVSHDGRLPRSGSTDFCAAFCSAGLLLSVGRLFCGAALCRAAEPESVAQRNFGLKVNES